MWKCRYIKLYLKLQAHPCLGKITSSQKKYKQYIQNLSKIDQKSALKTLLEGSWRLLGASWRGLGGLLGALGPILAPRAKKVPSTLLQPPSWTPTWTPNPIKIDINQHKINQTNQHFFNWFLNWFLMDFGRILGPNMGPTSIKNPLKNKSKNWDFLLMFLLIF